tara:strand:- start:1905 stop:3308 length:1404 start_codon:yes stop_codon:yes gene_type:complete
MASTYLTRTHGSAPVNTTKATVSAWVKRTDTTNHQGIMGVMNSGNNHINVQLGLFNGKWYQWYKDGSDDYFLQDSLQIPRDHDAWYHVVYRFDTTQGTASDRLRCYVNGTALGQNFSTIDNPSSNDDIIIGTNGLVVSIGKYNFTSGGAQYWNGDMAHVHYCDGYSYGPETFGSTDSTSGEWVPNTAPSVNYGNNGFFLKFADSSNLGLDSSGNGNNLTVGGGTLIQTKDTPSNNFCKLNTQFYSPDVTISNRGLTVAEASNNWRSAYGTMGVRKGKWYWEAVITYQSNNEAYIGVASEDHMVGEATYGGSSGGGPNMGGYDYVGYSTRSFGIYSNGNEDYPSTVTRTGAWNGDAYTMGVALDMDNQKFYISRNGVWTNGSNNDWGSSTFNASTGDIDISSKCPAGKDVFPAFSPNESTFQVNFGDGYFGTSAIGSPNADGAGYGKFKYAPPSGFYSLCTQNLNTYG